MKTFTIDENNNITVFRSNEEAAGATGSVFSSQKELAKLSAEWPVSRYIEIWNGFAGVAPFGELKPIKKFTDRKVAVARIWQAIQRLNVAVPEIATEPVAEVSAEVATEVAPGSRAGSGQLPQGRRRRRTGHGCATGPRRCARGSNRQN